MKTNTEATMTTQDSQSEQKTIAEVLNSRTKPFIAGHTDIGKLLAKTREDGRYTMAMYDCEMAIMKLIEAYVTTRVKEAELLKQIEIDNFLNLYHQHAADDLEKYLNASNEEKENWA